MRAAYYEMKQAGLSHTDMLWEALGAVSLFALPILMLFAGAAFNF